MQEPSSHGDHSSFYVISECFYILKTTQWARVWRGLHGRLKGGETGKDQIMQALGTMVKSIKIHLREMGSHSRFSSQEMGISDSILSG